MHAILLKTPTLLTLCLGVWVNAQSLHVRGKISAAGNQGLANATVELLVAKQKTVTGADGTYALTQGTAVHAARHGLSPSLALNRGVLEVSVRHASSLQVDLFDAQGHRAAPRMHEALPAGQYQLALPLPGWMGETRLWVVRATLGNETRTFPYLTSGQGVNPGAKAASLTEQPSIGNGYETVAARLTKIAAILDTLKVSAAGYATQKVPISNYDTTVNVTLAVSEDRWGGLGNPPGPSAGCGKAIGALKSGKNKISTGGTQRDFIIDIPADYKPNQPYRLFFCFHWYGGSADSIASGQVEFGRGGGPENYAYYGLKPLALKANEPAIFIAPQGLNNGWGGAEKDHAFFDDMLALAKANLCIDTTRVFSTGFSFGSMFTYSLTTRHQKQIRAGVGIAPANWNIWLPSPLPRDPIAWMQTTGMSDPNCKWIYDANQQQGAKFIALQRGQDNGCTVPADIPTTTVGSKTHVCYDFNGCKSGYPVKACTFDGAHIANVGDGGTGNVGKDSWIPAESWKFFKQF